MTAKQREYLSKYLSDISKGLLLAVAVGVGTNKLTWGYVVLAVLTAGLTLAWDYRLEGERNGTPQ